MFRTKPGEGRALIEDWINRPSLRKLVEAFDGTWPDGDLEHVVAELVQFSEVWDYRAGTQSRLMFHEDPGATDPFQELTYETASALGLSDPVPPSTKSFDHLLILGGLATGVEPRVRYAARLIDQGLDVRCQVAGLGSYRELQEKELPIARRYAPAGRYEVDHLAAMMCSLLGTSRESHDVDAEHPPQQDVVREIDSPADTGPVLRAYAALGPHPNVRSANTAETYELFLETTQTGPHQSALLVTSAIYVPYQHLDAIRVLGAAGIDVETVGVISGTSRSHRAPAYRQEIRSVLLSAKRLLALC